MRLASAAILAALCSPALAAPTGLPTGQFVPTWSALPSGSFMALDHAPKVGRLAAHPAALPDAALALLGDTEAADGVRRDLAVEEMAGAWEPAQRTALEDLRDAQRAYAATAPDQSDARDMRFVALLRQVVDGSGRSVARDPSGDESLNAVYERVIRDAPDATLAKIQASETRWTAYRDAFDRFAQAMDRTDAGQTVHADLTRHRAAELQAEAAR